MVSFEELTAQVKAQGEVVRALKKDGKVMSWGKHSVKGSFTSESRAKCAEDVLGGKRCLTNSKGRGTTGLPGAGFSAVMGLAAGHPTKRGQCSSPVFLHREERRGETGNAGFLAPQKTLLARLALFLASRLQRPASTCCGRESSGSKVESCPSLRGVLTGRMLLCAETQAGP